MSCCDPMDQCPGCRSVEGDETELECAIADADWRRVSRLVRECDSVPCPPEARAELDAWLFQRGLALTDEPGCSALMVVDLDLAAECAREAP